MSLIEERRSEWEAYLAELETFHESSPRPEDIRLTFGADNAVIYLPEEDIVKVYSRGGIMRFRREDAQALADTLEELFAELEPTEPEEPDPEE